MHNNTTLDQVKTYTQYYHTLSSKHV